MSMRMREGVLFRTRAVLGNKGISFLYNIFLNSLTSPGEAWVYDWSSGYSRKSERLDNGNKAVSDPKQTESWRK